MAKLLEHWQVDTVVSDQCEYGLLTPGPGGVPTPARKPTQWAFNSPLDAEAFEQTMFWHMPTSTLRAAGQRVPRSIR